jgi:hypothetical protein
MRRFLHLCLNRTPVIGLLMAALLFRALIPAGFMPTLASDGTIVMELCSGFTTKTVVVHLDGHADTASHGDHAGYADSHDAGHDSSHGDLFEHSPCGFAVAATSAGLPAVPAALVPVSAPSPLNEQPAALQTSPSILRSQTPRGPPIV